jgi:hypothetical protein
LKNNLSRILTIVAIALIAVCSAPAPAAAQNAYNGRFTLPSDVRWAAALLPAGEYTFSLKSNVLPAQIVIHGPNGTSMILTSISELKKGDAPSSLTIQHRNGMRVVSDLYLAELGIDLRYAAPKLPHNEIAQGPGQSEQVLVAMATK